MTDTTETNATPATPAAPTPAPEPNGSFFDTVIADVESAWGQIETIASEVAHDVWDTFGALLKRFTADELSILKSTALATLAKVEADPALVATPQLVLTDFISALEAAEMPELAHVGDDVLEAILAIVKATK